jgi:alkylhydroperoxidase/carboxymuconolactone decarboxylase family protein YurZ
VRYCNGYSLIILWAISGSPDLSPRDRSLVTVSALIARKQTIEMPYYFNLALDNGVKPSAMSEIVTHLAFYSGWAHAMSAVAVAKEVFGKRGIGSDQLPPASGALLPIDEAAEAQRAPRVEQDVGPVAPRVVQYTSDVLFHALWLRPALAPRDRSVVTVSALMAKSHVNAPSPHAIQHVYWKKCGTPKGAVVCPKPRRWSAVTKRGAKAFGCIAFCRHTGSPTRWWIPHRSRSIGESVRPRAMGETYASC